jgi:hypothetical protein
MRSRSYLSVIGIAGMLSACSTTSKIQSLKPLPDYANGNVVYEKQVSFINLPVELSVADIQTQTNKYMNGLIYEDNTMDGDNMMLKVWKQAPILVSENGGRLTMELPLKIWTRVKYGIEKFGFSATDTRELNLNGRIKLTTTANLVNWKLVTATQIDGIEWAESPTVSVMGKNMPVTYLINPALSFFKSRLAIMVDKSIAESFDIKPYVMEALAGMSAPRELDPEYHTWFAMEPIELYATKAVVANKKVTLNLGMKAYLESTIGSKPQLLFDQSKITLKAVEKMPNEFSANIAGFIRYPQAAAMMQANFAGQKYESGKRSVTVNKVDLWGKEGKLIVQLGITGSLNGDVYVAGTPVYHPETREVYLDQVDFVLDSKNKLMRTGSWLLHGLIVKKIQESCRFSMAQQLAESQKSMAAYFNNYEPMKGVKVNGALTELNPDKIVLTPNAIVAMVIARGKVAISINGME